MEVNAVLQCVYFGHLRTFGGPFYLNISVFKVDNNCMNLFKFYIF